MFSFKRLSVATPALLALALLPLAARAQDAASSASEAAGFGFIAHRGYSSAFPENTLPAVKAALDYSRKDPRLTGIEIDIRLTKDKKLAVFHDDWVAIDGVRTRVHQVDYSALVDASKAKLKGERVPLLDEVLACVDHKLALLVEIKGGGYDKAELMDLLAESLRKYDPRGDIVLHSFKSVIMELAVSRFEGRGVRFGVLVSNYGDLRDFRPALLEKVDFIHPSWKGLLEEPERFAALKKPCNVWTVDSLSAVAAIRDSSAAPQVAAIMTDDLALMSKLR